MSLIKKPKVIIIHDHPDLSHLIKRCLREKAECLMAADLNTATRLFEENPDILLGVVDGVMPFITGDNNASIDNTLEFLQKFRSNPKNSEVILVAYSGTHNRVLVDAGCNFECHLNSLQSTVLPILAAFMKCQSNGEPVQ